MVMSGNEVRRRDQRHLLEQISVYLANSGGRDEKFIKQFTIGYCAGISSLWLYSMWLQFQPKTKDETTGEYKERDDNEWFEKTITMISGWDLNLDSLSKSDKLGIDSFIYHIQFFQKVNHYLPGVRQGGLAESLEDTKGRVLKEEYSIASLFTLEQLKEMLRAENIIQDRRMIFVGSHHHAMAIFKDGDNFYYFDPNDENGADVKKSLDGLAEAIFDVNDLDPSMPSPLLFKMFSFDEKPKLAYPSTHEVLSTINPSLGHDKDYGNGYSGLIAAVIGGSLDSVKYFLEKDVDLKLQNNRGLNALLISVSFGDLEITKALLKKEEEGKQFRNGKMFLALRRAAHFGHFRKLAPEIIKALLKRVIIFRWVGSLFTRSKKEELDSEQAVVEKESESLSGISSTQRTLDRLGGRVERAEEEKPLADEMLNQPQKHEEVVGDVSKDEPSPVDDESTKPGRDVF